MLDFFGLFIMLAGFVIGLGAVTVIDLHGFFGMNSPYWTEATIRTHKITKPLIWIGIFFVIIGGSIFYRNSDFTVLIKFQSILTLSLIVNGLFLSFYVSPRLLERESEGRSREILPTSLQRKIAASFVISVFGWWGSLISLVWYLVNIP